MEKGDQIPHEAENFLLGEPPAPDYEKAEIDQLKDALNRSHKGKIFNDDNPYEDEQYVSEGKNHLHTVHPG